MCRYKTLHLIAMFSVVLVAFFHNVESFSAVFHCELKPIVDMTKLGKSSNFDLEIKFIPLSLEKR